MSLMGWSSESMAARYQHVTDAMRTEVASQVGDLIWQPGGGEESAVVLVRREPLATVLAFAHELASQQGSELQAAVAELQAALPRLAAARATSNETKTETRRPEGR